MDKRFPTVVNIGGRRYVKNNLNRTADNSGMKLKETIRSFGKRIQTSQLTQCVFGHGNDLHVYRTANIKAIFGTSNRPVGFIVTGKSEPVIENRYEKVPDDLESAVEKINNMSFEKLDKSQYKGLDVD